MLAFTGVLCTGGGNVTLAVCGYFYWRNNGGSKVYPSTSIYE